MVWSFVCGRKGRKPESKTILLHGEWFLFKGQPHRDDFVTGEKMRRDEPLRLRIRHRVDKSDVKERNRRKFVLSKWENKSGINETERRDKPSKGNQELCKPGAAY